MASVWTGSGTDRLNISVPVVVLAPGYHGHAIARSLGRLGVMVYGVHADPRSPSMRSRYWQENFIWNTQYYPENFTSNTSGPTEEETVDWLRQLGRKAGSKAHPILIPTDDSSCLFVADHADELKEDFLFPNQPAGLARSLSSKQQMYYLCKEYSIPTPETVFPRSRDDVVKFLIDATFPIMLKGIDTLALHRRTGMRMIVVNDAKTLLKLYNEWETPDAPNLMLQEYIPGDSEAVWMFNGYFDKNSDCLFGVTGKKIRQYPAYKGVTSLGVCMTNDAVMTQTKDFMKALNYRGILDIGYKYNARTGKYMLLDVNSRIGASFRLFVDTLGMDVARVLYRDLTGQPVFTGVLHEGRRWAVENFDLIASLTYYRDGKVGAWEWIRSFQKVKEAAWFAWDDPLPFVTMCWFSSQWVLEQKLKNLRLMPWMARQQNTVLLSLISPFA